MFGFLYAYGSGGFVRGENRASSTSVGVSLSIPLFARLRVTTLSVALCLLAGATIAVIQAPAALAAACNFDPPNPLPSADGLIETAADLQWLYDTSSAWSGSWEQTQDIDMGECEFSEGIGGASPYFTGNYDGGGYLIEGLDIVGSTLSSGLFADVNGGTLAGIRFSGSVTSSNGAVGGLVGQIYGGGQISDSSTSGTVNSGGNQVGGLVGRATGATIVDSSSSAKVVGIQSVGGLIGEGSSATVSRSFATGNVSASNGQVGGLVGYDNTSSSYQNSYAIGNVTDTGGLASPSIGGLAGAIGPNVTLGRTYATGLVTAPNATLGAGGLVGLVSLPIGGLGTRSMKITDSYWDAETSGQVASAGGEGKTTAEMTSISTYTTWSIAEGYDSSKVWGICSAVNSGYPYLTSFHTSTPCGGLGGSSGEGSGGTSPPPTYTFTFLTSGGGRCLADVTVTRLQRFTLPDASVACTPLGTSLAGWAIPGQDWAFRPGREVTVVDSQVFTAVAREPDITVTYDSNVNMNDACIADGTNVEHEEDRLETAVIPRTDMTDSLATGAPCTPPGFELTGWTDASTPAGSGQAQPGAATYIPGEALPDAWNVETPNPINAVRLYALWGRIGTSTVN